MYKIGLVGIEWDCDEPTEKKKLPTEVVIDFDELPDYVWDDLKNEIGDYLDNKYGYCNNGYSWQFINTKGKGKK